MKSKIRGWNEGVLSEDLRSMGGSELKKGSIVRYKKHKEFDKDSVWTGRYQWYYIDENNSKLIRTTQFLINTIK